jgi:hypothetical protein
MLSHHQQQQQQGADVALLLLLLLGAMPRMTTGALHILCQIMLLAWTACGERQQQQQQVLQLEGLQVEGSSSRAQERSYEGSSSCAAHHSRHSSSSSIKRH